MFTRSQCSWWNHSSHNFKVNFVQLRTSHYTLVWFTERKYSDVNYSFVQSRTFRNKKNPLDSVGMLCHGDCNNHYGHKLWMTDGFLLSFSLDRDFVSSVTGWNLLLRIRIFRCTWQLVFYGCRCTYLNMVSLLAGKIEVCRPSGNQFIEWSLSWAF